METNRCPVCGAEIKGRGVKARMGGKEVTVCCEDCANKAKMNAPK